MSFFIIDDIYLKLQKIYNKGDIFKNYIQDTELFPITIKLKKVQQKDIQGKFSLLLKQIQTLKDSPFKIEYKKFDFKRLGTQTLPILIKIDTVEEYCSIMNNCEYYNRFIKYYEKIILKYPILKELLYKKPMLVLVYGIQWDKLFLIVDYFIKNNNPNIYIRQISLKDIDTKYIEQFKKIIDILVSSILQKEPLKTIADFEFEKKYNLKYPLPQVRFRILDKDLYINNLSDITLNIDQFETLNFNCKKVFIVENKITFLALPTIKNSIVIFGSGYKVGVLKDVKWLQNKQMYYWGDIDIDGFAILSQIRGYFPQVVSLMMDQKTIDRFISKSVKSKIIKQINLKYLTKDEKRVYLKLEPNFRLEQEMIVFKYIEEYILTV